MLSVQQSMALIATGLLATMLGTSIARADTACRGLAADRCGVQSGCLWVKGYTRKDGKAVDGYCRSKGGKARAASEKGASADRAIPSKPSPARSQKTADAASPKRGG